MTATRFVRLTICVLATLAIAPVLSAAPPWNKLVVFKHLPTDPNAEYPVAETNGPWMIMAVSFSGEGAAAQARKLVNELRSEYKLPAYTYQKKFEFSKPVEGKGVNPYGEPPKMRFQRDKDYTEIAVVVGDYPTVDDPEAQKVLKRLKFAQPQTLAVEAGESTSQSLAALRTIQKEIQKKILPANSEDLKRGPMGNAFMITNPCLPQEYFVPKGLDKFVVDMNQGVPHSLLDCPGKYTVKVATFTGHSIILDEKNQSALASGKEPKSYLAEAAKNAHLLTEALRKLGYEAYEFHDRNSSIVTVGSFESVGSRRDDGKIEINPSIHKIMRAFGAETKVEPGKMAQVGKPKKLGEIPFDVQSMPVEVPRRAISTDYARSTTNTTLR
jgi:hypothetical protein